MTLRRLSLLFAIAVLSLAGLALAACGGDDGGGELTIDEYFERIAGLEQDLYDTVDAAAEEFDEAEFAAETDAETIAAIAEFVQEGTAAYQTFADEADALTPPDVAEAAHDAYVTATRSAISIFEDTEDSLEDATTADEGYAAFDQLSTGDAYDVWIEACEALNAIAEDEDVAQRLACE